MSMYQIQDENLQDHFYEDQPVPGRIQDLDYSAEYYTNPPIYYREDEYYNFHSDYSNQNQIYYEKPEQVGFCQKYLKVEI